MGLKVSDVYTTVNTKKNIFYSAYLKNKVQFNDVDPDKIMSVTDIESITDIEEVKNIEDIETVLDPII